VFPEGNRTSTGASKERVTPEGRRALHPACQVAAGAPRGESSRARQQPDGRDRGRRLTGERPHRRHSQEPLGGGTDGSAARRAERPPHAGAGCLASPHLPAPTSPCARHPPHVTSVLRSNAPRHSVPRPAPSLSRGLQRARGKGWSWVSWRRRVPGNGYRAAGVSCTTRPSRPLPAQLRRAARPGSIPRPCARVFRAVRSRREASVRLAPGRGPTPGVPCGPGRRPRRLQKASPKPNGFAAPGGPGPESGVAGVLQADGREAGQATASARQGSANRRCRVAAARQSPAGRRVCLEKRRVGRGSPSRHSSWLKQQQRKEGTRRMSYPCAERLA